MLTTADKTIKKFLENLSDQGKSNVSIKNYKSDIGHFLAWITLKLKTLGTYIEEASEITPFVSQEVFTEYKNYMVENKVKIKTANRRLSTLRNFSKFLHSEGLIDSDFMQGIQNLGIGGTSTVQKKVADIVGKFRDSLISQKVSPNTIKNYAADVRSFIDWTGKKSVNNIESNHIQTYREEVLKSSAASTFDRKVSSLRKFFDWAIAEGHVDENPIEVFLKKEAKTIQVKLGRIEKERKTSLPSYSSWQARIVAKLAVKPQLQKIIYHLFYTRPNWYKTYHALPIASYFNYAILILLMSALGFGVYNQFFKTTSESLAYPTTLTKAGRYLSFQGRLTTKLGNPITTATSLDFKLYNASESGTLLWDSSSCSITPDTDGIFATLLGKDCGNEIGSNVFSENAEVWLGITVGGDAEATPRVQIATVAYALNSETLQGYPASASATINTVPVINNLGQLVLAASSPTLKSTSGTFAIQGQATTITTADTSNGSITINPDGTGTLNLTFEGAAPGGGANGFVNATNANLTSGSLYYGEVASDASGYNLIQLASGSTPTDKFTVNSAGNLTAAGTINGLTISSGTISAGTWNGATIGTQYGGTGQNWSSVVQGSIPYFNGTGAMSTLSPGTSGYILSTQGGGANPVWSDPNSLVTTYWESGNTGALYPKNNTLDLLLGGSATTSAKFAFKNVLTGVPTASISGSTANVAAFIDGNGNISTTNRADLVLGNSSTYDTTGNILLNPNKNGNVGIGTTSPDAKLAINSTVSTTGSELITNGSFTGNADGWTLGGSASYNSNNVTSTGNGSAQTSLDLTSGDTYLVTFTLSGISGDSIYFYFSNNSYYSGPFSSDKTYSIAFTSNFTGTDAIVFENWLGNAWGMWTIDDVSVKKVAAPIIPSFKVIGYNGSTYLSLGGDILNNTAIGGSSLSLNTTGFDNSALGFLSLSSNTGGYGNSALGTYSLSSNTTGNENSAVGHYSLLSNTTGGENSAFGNSTLFSNTEGAYNTAIGSYAMFSNISGSGNSAFGSESLYNMAGGDDNAALGSRAGFSLTSGSYNTFLGRDSGNNASQKVNAANSTAIGYGAYTTADNQVVVGNSSVTETLLRGNVGINTTSPTAKLDVNGNINVTGYATASASLSLGNTSAAEGPGHLNMSGNLTALGTINGLGVSSGTVTSGTWHGTAITSQYGGTGADNSAAAQYSIPYYSAIGTLGGAVSPGTAGYVLSTNGAGGAPTWIEMSAVSGDNLWQLNNKIVSPGNSTYDLTIGGVATGSSFQVFGQELAAGNVQKITSSGVTTGSVLSLNSTALTTGTLLHLANNTANNAYLIRAQAGNSLTDRMTLTSNGYLSVYDTTGTNYLRLYHDGTNAQITTNTGNVEIRSGSGDLTLGDATDAVNIHFAHEAAPVSIGGEAGTVINFTQAGNITPAANATYDLGASGTAWADIYGSTLYQGAYQVCDSSGNCGGESGGSKWKYNAGAISPYTDYLDVLIGNSATVSAKFAFKNVAAGTPTASIAGTTTNVATYLTGEGNLAVTNGANLTLGGTTTGRIDAANDLSLASGKAYLINGTSVLNANTLGANIINSSLTQTGILTSGSIASGFGSIAVGNTITGTTLNGTTGINTGAGGGTQRIDSSGNLVNIGTTQLHGVTYTWPSADAETPGYVLTSNGSGALSWAAQSGGGESIWATSSGILYPKSNSMDMLIGGSATISAKFAFKNVLTGTPTASISGSTAGISTYLTGDGNLATTNMQPLVIGGATTGSVQISPKGSTGLFVNGSGNVGIGTTSPGATLDVAGAATISGTLTIGDGTTNAIQSPYGPLTLNYKSGPNTWSAGLTLTNLGNIGIGTTTPLSRLSIVGTSANSIGKAAFLIDQYESQDIMTASASGQTKMKLANDGTLTLYNSTSSISNSSGDITLNAASNFISFAGDSLGNIANATISGKINVGGLINAPYNSFALPSDATASTAITTQNDLFVGGDQEIKGGLYLTGHNIYNVIGGVSTGTISLSTSPTATDNYNALSFGSWLVNNSVNNGIAALMVNNSKGGDIFTASASGTAKMTLTNAGYLGIGTTSPSTTLQVAGTSTLQSILPGTDNTYSIGASSSARFKDLFLGPGSIHLQSKSADAGYPTLGLDYAMGLSTAGSLTTSLNGTSLLTITQGGNIGIGTTSPNNAKLDIVQSASGAYGLKLTNRNSNQTFGLAVDTMAVDDKKFSIFDVTNGAIRMTIDNSGYVGIGTTTPANSLHVGGGSMGDIEICTKAGCLTGNTGTAYPTIKGTYAYLYFDVGNAYAGYMGSDGFHNVSDRALKENFVDLDATEMLEKINSLPVTEWNFISQGSSIKHIGPTAQDFASVFGLGGDDKSISTIDPAGIALIGIQGLSQQFTSESALQKIEIQSLANQIVQNTDDGQTLAEYVSEILARLTEVEETIRTGAITLKDYTVEKLDATIATIQDLTAPRIATRLISPLADETDISIRIGNATESGKLAVQNGQGEEVASIDSSGNASFSGELTANILIANDSSISGTLYADNIKSKSLEEIKALLTDVETDQELLKEAMNWNIDTASDSAQSTISNQLLATDLYVTNNAAINSLSVTNTLAIGTDLVFSSSVDQLTGLPVNSIDTLSSPLKIQGLAMAPVEIMAGLFTIDTTGNVRITGNLAVGGNLNVAGKIESSGLNLTDSVLTRSNLVSATEAAKLLTLNNASGNTVSAIDASGSATFAQVATRGLTIAGATEATNSAVVDGVITTNATVGSGVIPAGTSEITIKNPNVTDYTLVYVTPTSTTYNYVLYVKSKKIGEFTVGFTNNIPIDVNFNWWIVKVSE